MKSKSTSRKRTSGGSRSLWPLVMRGWVILHPALTKKEYAKKHTGGLMRFAEAVEASVETDYFQRKNWNSHGVRLTREQWRQKYRPDCQMVRATLSLHNVKDEPRSLALALCWAVRWKIDRIK